MSDLLHESMMTLNPIIGIAPLGDNENENIHAVQVMRYNDLVTSVGYTAAKEHPEVRSLLQRFGTEVGRNLYGQNFWVDQMFRRLESLLATHDVAVTGIRYENELEMIDALNGLSAWIERPDLVDDGTILQAHSSETTLNSDLFDEIIVNNGTIGELGQALLDAAEGHYTR